jgi:Right handed beta helix region
LLAVRRNLIRLAPCALICAAAVLVAAGGAGARSAAVACGDTITADVTLTADLTACSGDGLIVAADGVRIDLNGHAVSGSGVGTGITVSGANVSVVNGAVRGFDVGVSSSFGSGNGTRLAGLTVVANRTGVVAFSQSGVIDRSTIAFNAGDGFHGVSARAWTIEDSQISDNAGAGMVLSEALFTNITRNTIARNGGIGIDFQFHVDVAMVSDNVVARNGGYGIRILDSTTKLRRNVARWNGNTGILLSENESPSSLPFYEITGNTANENAGAGIAATAGMPDGGGNAAKKNAATPQCVNIACSKN